MNRRQLPICDSGGALTQPLETSKKKPNEIGE
jgi:hypothetical protein